MRIRLRILLRLFLFWIGLQFFFRLAFILYQWAGGLSCGWRLSLAALWHGLPMDFSLLGYVFLLLSVELVLASVVRLGLQTYGHRSVAFCCGRGLILTSSTVLATASAVVAVADWEIYRNWQFHVDLTPFLYISHLSESLGSIPWGLTAALLIAIAAIGWGAYRVHTRWVWNKAWHLGKTQWFEPLVALLFGAVMLLPIRGGVDVATMNVSRVAFSANAFANHIAVNATWNFMRELLELPYAFTHYDPFLPSAEADRRYRRMMQETEDFPRLLRCKRPNVLVLLMESQSAKFSALLGQDSCTPHLDSVARSGVLFSRMYAASTRSDKGVVAVLAGYPAQGKKSIIKFPRKLERLSFFPRVLDSAGYRSTAFYYGGNADFMNFRTCAYLAGLGRVVEQRDFPRELRGQKWGVHDEFVYPRLLAECDTAQQPFCKMYFTLSNHEPFDLPSGAADLSLPEEQRMRRTARYADSCLNRFLLAARERPWWDSTLVVILADHGHRHPGNSSNEDPLRYHIPMVWTGGALRTGLDTVISTVTSQTDVAALILSQLGLPHTRFPFSRNTLAMPAKETGALVVYNHGYGWLTDSCGYIYDFDAQRILWRKEETPDSVVRDGEAFFQKHHEDYVGR